MHERKITKLDDKTWMDIAFESVVPDGALFMFPALFEALVEFAEDSRGVLDAEQRRELRGVLLRVLSMRDDVHRLPHCVFARDQGVVNDRGGWQYSPFIAAAIARLRVECDGDEGRLDVDDVVGEIMRREPLRGRAAELLDAYRSELESYTPQLVIRMMPTVYKREPIDEALLERGDEAGLLTYARRRSRELQLRLFLQLRPNFCIYVHPDGTTKESENPPNHGLGDALFGSEGRLTTFRTDDINFQMLVGFVPTREHLKN